ncbi:2-hydroxychromene-2-carboxylate isomerase [Bradyrhizobium liaoningense]
MTVIKRWTCGAACATMTKSDVRENDFDPYRPAIPVRLRQPQRLSQPSGDSGDRAADRRQVRICADPARGGIFKSTNNKSPAETLAGIKNKREFQAIETERFIKRFHVQPYVWNPHFPVNTLNLMRAAIAAQLEGVFEKYVEAAFHHMWREPKKMDDPEIAAKALASSGLDAQRLFTRAGEPEVKGKLIKNTEEAVARGAFGSPTFFVGNEMFFGKEQLREVEEMVLEGGE